MHNRSTHGNCSFVRMKWRLTMNSSVGMEWWLSMEFLCCNGVETDRDIWTMKLWDLIMRMSLWPWNLTVLVYENLLAIFFRFRCCNSYCQGVMSFQPRHILVFVGILLVRSNQINVWIWVLRIEFCVMNNNLIMFTSFSACCVVNWSRDKYNGWSMDKIWP